ncbi:rCG63416 [Rattus norvegicus]|uniref:RCG63416 n=1 Tax=Rattus norvegicus TaxID=10116 RepID=A6IN61_RAT|nr:rCG63416 [Rattus norvegicus]
MKIKLLSEYMSKGRRVKGRGPANYLLPFLKQCEELSFSKLSKSFTTELDLSFPQTTPLFLIFFLILKVISNFVKSLFFYP